jgi:hypothetical protein
MGPARAGTGAATHRQRNGPQRLAGCDAASAVPDGETRHLLGEGLLAARVVAAQEPLDPQVDEQFLTADRRVGQPPFIVAVRAT